MENEKNLMPETESALEAAPIEETVEEIVPESVEEMPAVESESAEETEPAAVAAESEAEVAESDPNSNLSSLLSELSQEDDSYLEQETVAVKKPISKVVIGVIIAAVVVAIGVVAALWFMANPPRTGELGNSFGNLLNSGVVCEDDGWLYYMKTVVTEEQSSLVVEKTDGKSTVSVVENATMLSVADDYLYFVDLNAAVLCRSKLDGSNKQTLTDGEISRYVIKGNYIYYTEGMVDSTGMRATYTAYEMRLDGSDKKKISTDTAPIMYMMPMDDALYYQSSEDGCLYKMPYGGGTPTAVLTQASMAITIDGDSLYYVAYNDTTDENAAETTLYKADLNGQNPQKIADNVMQVNAVDGRLYYVVLDGDSEETMGYVLYTADADGGNAQKIAENVMYPNVANELLYYMNLQDGMIYRANLDGSDPRVIQ